MPTQPHHGPACSVDSRSSLVAIRETDRQASAPRRVGPALPAHPLPQETAGPPLPRLRTSICDQEHRAAPPRPAAQKMSTWTPQQSLPRVPLGLHRPRSPATSTSEQPMWGTPHAIYRERQANQVASRLTTAPRSGSQWGCLEPSHALCAAMSHEPTRTKGPIVQTHAVRPTLLPHCEDEAQAQRGVVGA